MYRLQEESARLACTAVQNHLNTAYSIKTTEVKDLKIYAVISKIAKILREIIQLRHTRHSVLEPTTTGPIHHPRLHLGTEVAGTTDKTLATRQGEGAGPRYICPNVYEIISDDPTQSTWQSRRLSLDPSLQ